MNAPDTKTHIDLIYRLKGLAMAGTVLHLGAHPDDEDVGLLSYLSCKFGIRSVYWSATRAEGGQNRIGPYTEEALQHFRAQDPKTASVYLLETLSVLRKTCGSIPSLGLGIDAVSALKQYLSRKTSDVETVCGRCRGLKLEGLSNRSHVIPGEAFTLQVRFWNHGSVPGVNLKPASRLLLSAQGPSVAAWSRYARQWHGR